MHDGVVAPRPGAVARSARSYELRAARHLLRGGNLYESNPAVFGVDEASFGKRIFRFDLRPMLLHQILDADVVGPVELSSPASANINHVAVERHAQALELQHQH